MSIVSDDRLVDGRLRSSVLALAGRRRGRAGSGIVPSSSSWGTTLCPHWRRCQATQRPDRTQPVRLVVEATRSFRFKLGYSDCRCRNQIDRAATFESSNRHSAQTSSTRTPTRRQRWVPAPARRRWWTRCEATEP